MLDRTNEDFLKTLTGHFITTPIRLWEGIHDLHSLEIVDLYESEIVRISDQVLATYMFYKCFISEQLLDFSILLEHFFYGFPNKFKDSLYPIFYTFDREFVISRIQSAIDVQWQVVKDDDEKWLLFSSVFWFLKPTDTLSYFKERIDALEPDSYELDNLDFKPDDSVPPLSPLGVLSLFQFASPQNFKSSLELILYYLEVSPSILPSVMYLLLEVFCFQKESYYQNYNVQLTIIETLLSRIKTNHHPQLYTKILLNVAGKYLGSRFESNMMESRNTVTLYQFNLVLTTELKSIRKQVLDFLISLYQDVIYRDEVLQIVRNYYKYPRNQPESEIVEYDSHLLLPFISTSFDPNQYFHCIIVNDYLHHLDTHKVTYQFNLKDQFVNETYKIAQILLEDLDQRVNLGYEEYQEYRRQRIHEHFSEYNFDDYKKYFDHCLEIANHDVHRGFPEGFFLVFKNLADINPQLFQQVLVYFLGTGNHLNYYDFGIAHLLMLTSEDLNTTYKILKEQEFSLKYSWIHAFLMLLPQENINQYFVDELFNLYESAPLPQILRGFDFLQKYSVSVGNIFVKIARIIFFRISHGDGDFSFFNLFLGDTTRDKLEKFFANDIELLKQIYFYETSQQSLSDYHGSVFQQILNLNPTFITEYLEWMYNNHDYLSDHSDHRDYSFLWSMSNYQQTMNRVIFFIKNKSKGRIIGRYANTFFVNHKNDPAILKRMLAFLADLINVHSSDTNLMSLIFDVVSEIFQDQLVDFLSLFLDKNKNFEDFQSIRFEVFDPVVWGNQISEHEKRIEHLESILPLMGSLELLQHKQLIERKVLFWRKQIEQINRDAFIGGDW